MSKLPSLTSLPGLPTLPSLPPVKSGLPPIVASPVKSGLPPIVASPVKSGLPPIVASSIKTPIKIAASFKPLSKQDAKVECANPPPPFDDQDSLQPVSYTHLRAHETD